MYSGNDPAHAGGCPIRTSLDHSLLAAPQGFSQRATSFIASWRQGIHRMPFSCSPQTFHAGSPRTAPKRAPGPHRTRSMEPPVLTNPNAPAKASLSYIHIRTHSACEYIAGAHTYDAPDAHEPGPIPYKDGCQTKPCRAPHERPNPDSHRKDHTTFPRKRRAPPQRATNAAGIPETPAATRLASRPAPPWRCLQEIHPQRDTTLETPPLETTGIEPVTPCLQSRCSPS